MKVIRIGLFIFLFLLTNCEDETPVLESPIDYTGESGFVTDIDGNTYKTVGIGTQIWMAENLKTSTLKDGTSLPYISENTDWKFMQSPAYCWYQNDSLSFKRYGALYNFYAVETNSLCPIDWRVPNENDLNILIKYLGGDKVAAGKLKSYAQGSWESPNKCFDNDFHFAALPGGYRSDYLGQFQHKGYLGFWWYTTDRGFTSRSFCMTNGGTNLIMTSQSNEEGCSVRCIKNNTKR